MNRRTFVTGLGAATAMPLGAEAQQPATPRRVGVLLALLSPDGKEAQAFRQGLRDAGYGEGREVAIEWRSANGNYARLPKLAADLVERKVDVIVADITLATQAAKRATTTIPIVMAIVADPIGSGLVQNLAQPGGNVTGLSIMLAELASSGCSCLRRRSQRLRESESYGTQRRRGTRRRSRISGEYRARWRSN
jgi:putative tryptophan/tyrosine transport system substrate-binding protein